MESQEVHGLYGSNNLKPVATKRLQMTITVIIAAVIMVFFTITATVMTAGMITVMKASHWRENDTMIEREIHHVDGTLPIPAIKPQSMDGLVWKHAVTPIAWAKIDNGKKVIVYVMSHGVSSCWRTNAIIGYDHGKTIVSAVEGLDKKMFALNAIGLSTAHEQACSDYAQCKPMDGYAFYVPSCKPSAEAIRLAKNGKFPGRMPVRTDVMEPLPGVQVQADYDLVGVIVDAPSGDSLSNAVAVTSSQAAEWQNEADFWAKTN